MLEEIVRTCQFLLESPQAESVRKYAASRASKSAIESFQVGYFPKQSELSLLTNFLDEERLLKSGLFHYRFSDEDGKFSLHSTLEEHNLVMPYKDSYGRTLAFVGRTDNEGEARGVSKYKNTSFSKSEHLFGLYKAKSAIIRQNSVFVVEGQFDCITAISNGIENCVCLGSGNMSSSQFALLSRYTNNIILLLDNDAAGKKGTERAVEKYGVRTGNIPQGYKDLDQFLLEEGKAAKEYVEQFSS